MGDPVGKTMRIEYSKELTAIIRLDDGDWIALSRVDAVCRQVEDHFRLRRSDGCGKRGVGSRRRCASGR